MYVARRGRLFDWPAIPIGVKHDLRGSRPIAEHSHDFAEVVVVVRGHGVQSSAVGEIELTPGTVVMLRPGSWHGTDRARDLEYFNLYLSPELFLEDLSWVLDSMFLTGNLIRGDEIPGRLDAARLARVTRWFDVLVAEIDELRRPALIGLAACILAELVDIGPATTRAPARSPAVIQVMTAVMDALPHPWSVAELAGLVALSPSQLHRRFVGQVGLSVTAWLDQVRGERAAALLSRTDTGVAEVGRRVGWPDPSYAARRFRRLYGMAPTEYRRRFHDPGGRSLDQSRT